MTKTEKKAALYDLLYLTKCGIKGELPDEKSLGKMELESVYKAAKFHVLEAVTYYAIENAKLPESETLKKWRESRDKAIRKNLLFEMQTSKLFSFMNEKGIAYMPLKGIILKGMYPKAGMRQMSDNDILFDGKFRSEVHDWFEQNGFEAAEYMTSHHDNYKKAPVFYYEMHVELYGEKTLMPLCPSYYLDVWDRLIRDRDDAYSYRFSDEDFYVFITAHSCKHYVNGGTGLRSLLDTYVYLKAKGDALDMAYIERETKKLGIDDFEKKCRELSMKVFASDDKLTQSEEEMLDRFLFAGAYGTVEGMEQCKAEKKVKDSNEKTKLGYIKYRLMPDDEALKKHYPFFYKHKILLPFLWIYRLFKGITVKRK